MRTGYASIFPSVLALTQRASANFFLKDIFVGHDFLDGWTWQTIDDPTHGRVNYVDQPTALQANLSYATGEKFVMRADDWSTVPASARGRDSIRIVSNDAYEDAVFVLDLEHMPQGCSTWPAFWTLSEKGPWPKGGEIDIIEGVNLATNNQATLHTLPSCTEPDYPDRRQTGTTISTNCDTSFNFNQGCGVSFTSPAGSYGAPFNAARGGHYAMARTRQAGVQVWFWPRSHPRIPEEIKSGADVLWPNPSWGTPVATFSWNTCDYDAHFDAHQMIFDLTLCGDWAGNAWSTSGCGTDSCVDYVNNNPSAFAEAYWEINSLRVYTPKW
ncbi:hypothetical protein BV25DRAFT_1912879 [Artomyces pyxidatus]|uniref:Uncharacterized protein n=1 Tax=Artomyces pyxidatus TaxID=48021 RepID=A0ACB8TBY5_9AGAM|nr:hypothetical protein BV25DRAFT_1912879 [Artomyces pyxidatus]